MQEIEQIIENFINQTAHFLSVLTFFLIWLIHYFHRKENRSQNSRIKVLENALKEKENRLVILEERLTILEKQFEEKKF